MTRKERQKDMIQKKGKRLFRQRKKQCQWIAAILMQLLYLTFYQTAAYASDTTNVDSTVEQILQPFTIVKTLLVAAISAVGVIILIKNIASIGTSLQQQDSTGLSSALMGAAGGLIMAAAGILISLFGF